MIGCHNAVIILNISHVDPTQNANNHVAVICISVKSKTGVVRVGHEESPLSTVGKRVVWLRSKVGAVQFDIR